ncbi:MAG: hypothetical protein F4Z82_20220 [Caldilineaceae bacterium SB0668_bin_21]|nr:hypothetical protein [Caldilineaceae bacterium SB0668_bin_21]MYC22900.1 hypothetical protein [Caldilineaceae bacterium SB0662_bin_25]
MIRIQETKTEYLLSIPAAQKERARGIQGRRWDPQRVCWVYPRNTRMYHALIAEFGDDLTSESSFTPPQTILGQDRSNAQDAAELQQNIERIDQTLSELLKFLDQADNERAEILLRQQSNIESLRAESQTKDEEIAILKTERGKLLSENKRLSAAAKTYSDGGREEMIRKLALEVTGHDQTFGEAIGDLKIDATLPLQVGRKVENLLTQTLRSSGTFYELITECDDAEMLDEESVDLAHIIRKQRNVNVHPVGLVDPKTELGRGLLCLFCASLLYPKLTANQ